MSVPQSLKSDQLDDGAALTTPLSVTGAPKELDEQMGTTIGGVCGVSLGAVLNLEECERTDGGCRQRSQGSSQETNQLEIAIQQELDSKYSESTDGLHHERKLKRFRSSPAPTQATTVEAESDDLLASAGSLFDIEPQNDN